MHCDRCGGKIAAGSGKMIQVTFKKRQYLWDDEIGGRRSMVVPKIERVLLCDKCFARLVEKLTRKKGGLKMNDFNILPMVIKIPLPPVTKKNSMQVVDIGRRCPVCHRGKRSVALPSKAYTKYAEACKPFLAPFNGAMIAQPVNVKAIYYMPTKHRVDLCNLHNALHDILVFYGVLEDDNRDIVAATDGSRAYYDKDNPRTEILIDYLGV